MGARGVSVDLDEAPRRPIRPWMAVMVAAVAVAVAGVLVAQSQAMAGEAERWAVPPGTGASAGAASDADPTAAAQTAPGDTAPSAQTAAHAPIASSSTGSPSTGPTPISPMPVIPADPTWTATTAARVGIPARALQAYAAAALTVTSQQPECGLGWNTLAALGEIESAHGMHSGGVLRADGRPDPPIRGIALDGTASAAIADTDDGRLDGDAVWDRAIGPLQFIPSTWQRWGADANGDGVADPNQIDDAALAAGRALCAAGEMTSAGGWRRAVFSYNHLESYVDEVAVVANAYAQRASG